MQDYTVTVNYELQNGYSKTNPARNRQEPRKT